MGPEWSSRSFSERFKPSADFHPCRSFLFVLILNHIYLDHFWVWLMLDFSFDVL